MERIECCKCGKAIGEMVYDGAMNSPLGRIPCYHAKMDYRKAAHLALSKGRSICKPCARKIFPEGKSYSVNFNYHGRDMTIMGGLPDINDRYATLADAEVACKKMNNKKNGSTYRVVEHKL